MSSTRLYRLALPAALVALLAAALFTMTANALATTTTIPINAGNVPAYAADVPTQLCSANQGGGPYAGQDVWVFVLPGNHATSGDFVSVTLHFDTNADNIADLTLSITADGGGFLNGGPAVSKAWIATTAGYQLIDASADITGTAASFNLSHTCPATSTPSPTPPTSAPPTTEPPTSAPPTTEPPTTGPPTTGPPTTEPPSTPPTTITTDPSSSPPTSAPPSSAPPSSAPPSSVPPTTQTSEPVPSPSTTPGLPTTGTALSGILLAGVAMIVVGAALLVARRRRDTTANE